MNLRYPAILLLGDSLLQDPAFASLALQRYSRRADVLIRAFGGFNSGWLLELLPDLLLHVEPAAVCLAVLLIGTNDACVDPPHRTEPEHYGNNVGKILDLLEAHSGAPVLLITPPPTEDDKIVSNRGRPRDTRERAEIVRRTAAERTARNVHLVDLWPVLRSVDNVTTDGVHLTAEAYRVMWTLCEETLDRLLFDPPMVVPWWADYHRMHHQHEHKEL